MLTPFRRRKAATEEEQAVLPDVSEALRIYAIGDIHGRDDLLAELLAMIEQDEARRPPLPRLTILLGDLVDRGRLSAQVVERAMRLPQSGGDWRFIKGNHEEVFIAAARGNVQTARFFRRIGGVETLLSYGLSAEECAAISDEDLARWMLANIPRDHVDFLDGFEDRLIIGGYLFVHAGVRPHIPLEAQDPADLRWIRQDFLSHRGDHGRMVIHGHSIREDIDIRHNRIGIDTGAYRTGRLTAIGLEGTERWFVQTEG
ncbi:metallophosphoesterase family protein [Sphingobium bisphenolivorans]|uniref:metallophosphoesterase n=1 Tax=Sphingobium bisphenolivorans TaxID=1335760 RepID=UPI0004843C7D